MTAASRPPDDTPPSWLQKQITQVSKDVAELPDWIRPAVAPDDTTRPGFKVVSATERSDGWAQCQVCKGFAAWTYGHGPAWTHVGDCPIRILEAHVAHWKANYIEISEAYQRLRGLSDV